MGRDRGSKSRGVELREYLKPDSQGFYVILVGRDVLDRVPESLRKAIVVEEVSECEVVLKTRSRSVAKKILEVLGMV